MIRQPLLQIGRDANVFGTAPQVKGIYEHRHWGDGMSVISRVHFFLRPKQKDSVIQELCLVWLVCLLVIYALTMVRVLQ